ncbi:hypothetical protein HIM_05807 [Hirsutella minnesotensis 3608]|uniref:Transcription factor domain-containing protein n=1 Tax=Hirsutella minnesotensis 3608 TaxID=1043627 RepID=A0A0F7ZP11_9HYPO|nr:hypothetical protein HIM_05807 [Hirsutella minnesotensis 3608]
MRLFDYFVAETASRMQTGSSPDNPYVKNMLPAAYNDDMLMHSILAVGGAHLAYNSANREMLDITTRRHYSRALQGVRDIIGSQTLDESSLQRLALTLAFLCRYEVLSTAPQSALRFHLKAMQQIFSSLAKLGYTPFTKHSSHQIDELLALSYEWCAYLLRCNAIFSAPDTCMHDALPKEVYSENGARKSGMWETGSLFGTMTAGCQDLFGLIPIINDLHNRRLVEEEAGQARPSEQLLDSFNEVQNSIASWRLDNAPKSSPTGLRLLAKLNPVAPSTSSHDDLDKEPIAHDAHTQRILASEVIRHSLHVYSLVSLEGSSAGLAAVSQGPDGPIQTNVRIGMDFLIAMGESSYNTHLLWAILTIGSCTVDPFHRELLKFGFGKSRFIMRHVLRTRDILELLWADEDPQMYGPHGIRLVLAKYGIDFSIS